MKFNELSSTRLETCEEDLQLVLNTVKKTCSVSLEISGGAISIEIQESRFLKRKSRINPDSFVKSVTKAGKKSYKDELFVREKSLVLGKKYPLSRSVKVTVASRDTALMVAGQVLATANVLKASKKIQSDIVCRGINSGVISDNINDLCKFDIV